MKTLLLILMTLASVAVANDAKMKALLVGTWADYCTIDKVIYQADGKLLAGCDDPNPSKWDIKNGDLLESDAYHEHSYRILLLTKHEFLAQLNARNGLYYIFLTRHDSD